VLNPRLLALAEKVLPRFLLARLDPFRAMIEAELAVAASQTGPGDIVLDAGAGEARSRKYFTHGRYFALDRGHGDATWDYSGLDIRGDLEEIPLRSTSVDRILCIVVLEHTRDPKRVLGEFARIMKPGARLHLVVPFLWEEHQQPYDYHRFTRYGVRLAFESLPFEIELLRPMGGFFQVCARRCVGLLGFFQGGWRWPLFALLAPFFGLVFPLLLPLLDRLDVHQAYTLGFHVRARRLPPGET
jgi:SAM-dependent methyltransferase